MTSEVPAVHSLPPDVPAGWVNDVQAQLLPHENVLAALEVDLDAQLHFVKGLVLVTPQRLLSSACPGDAWQSWDFSEGLNLLHHDHAGVAHLELVDAQQRLASWRFTLGQNLQAIRLVDQFHSQLQSHVTGKPLALALHNVCPSCKAPLEPDQEECPICTKVVHTPPSTWTLFRLWRFAKPYQGQLLLGFFLMARWLINSKFGRVLQAVRDAETRVMCSGYNPIGYKLTIWTISAMMCGVAGALYVPQVGIINPSEMSPANSIEIAIWAAVGGRATLIGPILGAFIVNGAKSWLTVTYPEFWLYFLGALFIGVTLYLPDGVVGLVKKLKGGSK